MTTTTTNRLSEIAQRQRASRTRSRLFILAVALVTLVTAGSIALATTAPSIVPSATAAPMTDSAR